MIDPAATPALSARVEEALPLPKWLTRVYYVFPIVLYVPDSIFNFFVYSDGVSTFTPNDITTYPQTLLWGFLSVGIVGMAWLLSVLAPWHWVRGNKFQSIMCWCGVIIATAITTWCSLAWRSRTFTAFTTDQWVGAAFHVNIGTFSPTMVLVAVAPPFWGLFWAIVQPAERRRNASEQAEEFELKKLRMQQEAELKKMRAESNAQIRGAQLAGLAASMKAARTQIGAAIVNKDAPGPVIVGAEATRTPALLSPAATGDAATRDDAPANEDVPANGNDGTDTSRRDTRTPVPTGSAFVALVAQARQTLHDQQHEATWQTITAEIERAGYETPDRIQIARALRTIGDQLGNIGEAGSAMSDSNKPRPNSSQYPQYIHDAAMQMLRDGENLSLHALAKHTAETVEDVAKAIQTLRNQRLAKMKPGKRVADDPVLAAL